MLKKAGFEIREVLLNCVMNQIRYPNLLSQFFINLILTIFNDRNLGVLHEQIARFVLFLLFFCNFLCLFLYFLTIYFEFINFLKNFLHFFHFFASFYCIIFSFFCIFLHYFCIIFCIFCIFCIFHTCILYFFSKHFFS